MLKPKKRERAYLPASQPRAEKMENRRRSDNLYHTYRWTKASRVFRELHPLCESCKQKGVVQLAEVVDHIIPYPVCRDFFDEKNWQSLCKKCNIEKGNKDKKIIQNFLKNKNSFEKVCKIK